MPTKKGFSKNRNTMKSKSKLKDYSIYAWKSKNDIINDTYNIYYEQDLTQKEVIELYEERIRRGYDFCVQIYENSKQIYRSKIYDDIIENIE